MFQLFDHIAECIVEFIHENNLHDEILPLGFTFSFPCKQQGLAKVIFIVQNWALTDNFIPYFSIYRERACSR